MDIKETFVDVWKLSIDQSTVFVSFMPIIMSRSKNSPFHWKGYYLDLAIIGNLFVIMQTNQYANIYIYRNPNFLGSTQILILKYVRMITENLSPKL